MHNPQVGQVARRRWSLPSRLALHVYTPGGPPKRPCTRAPTSACPFADATSAGRRAPIAPSGTRIPWRALSRLSPSPWQQRRTMRSLDPRNETTLALSTLPLSDVVYAEYILHQIRHTQSLA